MIKGSTYTSEMEMFHNEIPAAVNKETGEVRLRKAKKKNNIPEGKSLVNVSDFSKLNTACVQYLKQNLSMEEMYIVFQMIGMAEFNTNSMRPLSNDTTQKELSLFFGVNKNQVKAYFKHLFDLGVYAQLKIAKYGDKEYWILNPYISFKGKTTDTYILNVFQGTIVTDLILYGKTKKVIPKLIK